MLAADYTEARVMPTTFTRRSFVAGAAFGTVEVFARSLRAAEYTFTQFHNQTTTSSLHKRLVEMWAAIRTETRGRVETEVFAQNNKLAGSDPAALKMLVGGEIQFFTQPDSGFGVTAMLPLRSGVA